MHALRLFIVGVSLGVTALRVIAGGVPQTLPSAGDAFKVIGYYAEWTSERYPVAEIPADKLTHVNYAFAKIGPDNQLLWNTRLFDRMASLKQTHPRLKFICRSAGGPIRRHS